MDSKENFTELFDSTIVFLSDLVDQVEKYTQDHLEDDTDELYDYALRFNDIVISFLEIARNEAMRDLYEVSIDYIVEKTANILVNILNYRVINEDI